MFAGDHILVCEDDRQPTDGLDQQSPMVEICIFIR